MNKTLIEWTDYSWPVINGCTRVSPGCGTGTAGGCYAERLAATRLSKTAKYGGLASMVNGKPRWTGQVRLWEPELSAPLKLRKPSRIFVCDMGDLFHESVPDEWIDRIFAVMALAPHHTFQVLTKRPERMQRYFVGDGEDPEYDLQERAYAIACRIGDFFDKPAHRKLGEPLINRAHGFEDDDEETEGTGGDQTLLPLPNVHLGVSAEDQQRADQRIPLLLQTPAAVRFLSLEPLIGPIDLKLSREWLTDVMDLNPDRDQRHRGTYPFALEPEHRTRRSDLLHWAIIGGESGPRARPCDVEWLRSIVAQCKSAGTAAFVKQLGAEPLGWCAGLLHADPADYDPEDFAELHKDHTYCDAEEGDEGSCGGRACQLLRGGKNGDPAHWPEDLRVREFPGEVTR